MGALAQASGSSTRGSPGTCWPPGRPCDARRCLLSVAVSFGADDCPPLTSDSIVEEAVSVEADGLNSYWLPNQFDLGAPGLIGYLAREVTHIELGAGLLPIFTRHPLLAAQEALTAQLITAGRFVLGLGLEHKVIVEDFFGDSFANPVERLVEYLTIVRSMLGTSAADYQGSFYRCKSVSNRLPLGAVAAVPIILGALGPKMLRVAGEMAEGTITWLCGPATLESYVVPTITAAASNAGRPAPRVIATLPVCVTRDEAAVRSCIERAFGVYEGLPSYQRAGRGRPPRRHRHRRRPPRGARTARPAGPSRRD
ncbi:MAG: TIGR03564 family F420-dependent LLM class oxidoreductase [Actinomycetota bacterium]|nr:TIGR03564 family F420-dependent LLM class oxidoreductase [Actinomycetota bacterium]